MRHISILIISVFLLGFSVDTSLSKKEQFSQYMVEHVINTKSIPFGLDFQSIKWTLKIAGVVIDISPSLHFLFLQMISLIMIIFTFLYVKVPSGLAPKGGQNLLELMVVFIRDEVAIKNLGVEDGKKMTPLFLTFFLLIILSNYIGLIPGMTTITGNVNVTLALSLIVLFVMIYIGFKKNGPIGFFKIFVPSGLPIVVAPLIFLVEFAGLVIKPAALCIRLFANMLAGHLVLISLIGLTVLYGIVGIPSVFMVLMIYIIKLLVCFLQAYIFVLLSSMFIGMMAHPH